MKYKPLTPDAIGLLRAAVAAGKHDKLVGRLLATLDERKQPSDRDKAAMVLSFFLRQATDAQVKLLLKMTIRDWVDWIHSKDEAKR